jgi:thiamine-monophosphate kinase
VDERELIEKYFLSQALQRDDVAVGIGDDAAVLTPPPGKQLVVTTDTLVEGVHFFSDADPAALGHKSLAVNLSDLAAMAAYPLWFTLSLTLPKVDPAWLKKFCDGMFALANRYRVALVGGNLARGPLNITVEAFGSVTPGTALLRSQAKIGDRVFVTGTLGDAALALQHRLGKLTLSDADARAVGERLHRPTPRIDAGMLVREFSSCAIDISDGLGLDLSRVLAASGVGATVALTRLPLSEVYRRQMPSVGIDGALAGGEDYELCFTVAPDKLSFLRDAVNRFDCPLTEIGEIVAGSGLTIKDADGNPVELKSRGFDHFAA